MEKLVSVIITTYGRSREFLAAAIDSVKKQTYENIELIVVDDNGLGTEQQILNERALRDDGHLCYLPNAVNSGVQFSRNHGLMNSHGEYIAFLDDDDVWAPEKIGKQVELLEKENLGMAFCNGVRFKGSDFENVIQYQKNFISNRLITYEMELTSDKIGSTSIPLIRRECFYKAGIFDPIMPARQDYDMWLRICRDYKVKGIDEPLFYYRFHDGDRITKSFQKDYESHKLLWNKYKNDFCGTKEIKTNAMLRLAIPSLRTKRYFQAAVYTLRAVMSRPVYTIKFIFGVRKKF